MCRLINASKARWGRAVALGAIMVGVVPAIGAAAPGAVSISSVSRSVEASASHYNYLPGSYASEFDLDQEGDRDRGGVWNRNVSILLPATSGAPDGSARVDFVSDVSSSRFALSSEIVTQGGNYPLPVSDADGRCCLRPDGVTPYSPDEWTDGRGRSRMRVQFQVDEPTPFTASLSDLVRRAAGASWASAASVLLSRDLSEHSGYVFAGGESTPYEPAEILLNTDAMLADYAGGRSEVRGILEPGWWYRIDIRHNVGSGDPINASVFDFMFVVPEPGTALLLGLGLMSLAAARPRLSR